MTMQTHAKAKSPTAPDVQRGMALITAMLLLIVVTIMALSMFRSYGVEERLAGNTRDKQRAINAAVSAQQYAESWLASGAAPASGVCPVGFVPSSTSGEVCTPPPAPIDFTVLPWTTGVTYTPVHFQCDQRREQCDQRHGYQRHAFSFGRPYGIGIVCAGPRVLHH